MTWVKGVHDAKESAPVPGKVSPADGRAGASAGRTPDADFGDLFQQREEERKREQNQPAESEHAPVLTSVLVLVGIRPRSRAARRDRGHARLRAVSFGRGKSRRVCRVWGFREQLGHRSAIGRGCGHTSPVSGETHRSDGGALRGQLRCTSNASHAISRARTRNRRSVHGRNSSGPRSKCRQCPQVIARIAWGIEQRRQLGLNLFGVGVKWSLGARLHPQASRRLERRARERDHQRLGPVGTPHTTPPRLLLGFDLDPPARVVAVAKPGELADRQLVREPGDRIRRRSQ